MNIIATFSALSQTQSPRKYARAVAWLSAVLLAGCVASPTITPAAAPIDIFPDGVASAGERYVNAEVVWGGQITEVRNGAQDSEVLVLAYPLDVRQRPLPEHPSVGGFVAQLSGYVEAQDFPRGRFITFSGALVGTRDEVVGEHTEIYPLLKVDNLHVWPLSFDPSEHFHVGIGIRGEIR